MNYSHILVTTDFSPASERVYDLAAYQAKMEGSALTLLHVLPKVILPTEAMGTLPDPSYAEGIDKAAEESVGRKLIEAAKSFHGQKVSTKVISTFEHPGDVIAEYARKEKCDLIVMASQSKGTLARFFLGSTIDRVLRHAPCPVLAIPPKQK